MKKSKKEGSTTAGGTSKDIFSNDRDTKTWKLLLDSAHMVMKAREKELRKYNISAIKSIVLVLVQASNDTLTPADLARRIHRDPHTTSELLSRMEAEELITKIKDLPRKNQIRVALTEKGRNAYNKAVKRESIHNIMSALSAGEQRQMAAFLKKIQQRAQLQLK